MAGRHKVEKQSQAIGAPRLQPLEQRMLLAGDGLVGSYFSDRFLENLAFERTDATIDFEFGSGSPDPSINNDGYSVRWAGKLTADTTETYTLRALADDGVRVFVDGVRLIDEWTDHPPTSYTAEVDLVAGQAVDVVVEYYENGGGATMRLFWSSATVADQIIPASAWGQPDPPPEPGTGDGLLGTYYNNADFTDQRLQRVDPTLDFDFGLGSPDPIVQNDTFSVRWEGQLEALYTETYTLRSLNDDGVRVYLDGELVIDEYFDRPPTSFTADVDLVAGERVDLVVEYYENGGGAAAKLYWSSPSQVEQIIPQTALYSPAQSANTDPQAAGDALTVILGSGTNTLDVLANDTDAEGDPLTITAVSGSALGAIVFNNGDAISYLPFASQPDTDTLTYTVTDGRGGLSTATVTIDLVDPPFAGNGDGLRGTYYGDRDFNTVALQRVDPQVNFDFGLGSPDPVIASDNFSVRWQGRLVPLYSETYTISTVTDDGVRLFVDGQLLIDDFTDHPPTRQSGQIALTAGQPVDIVMEYYEGGGGAVAQLFWESPTQAGQLIPQSALYSPDAPINAVPIAAADTLTLEQDSGSADIAVLDNDTDADDDPLTVTSVTQGASGSVATDGTVATYTPSAGFSGLDAFTYTISDGRGGTATATVDVTVSEVNRGTLALGVDRVSANEADGTVVIPVTRTGGSDGAVDADYVILDGTAVGGEDFVADAGTVFFADGQTVANVTINLLNDEDVEGPESFGISLDRVGGGAGLGAPRTALIDLEDDEEPEVIEGNGLLGEYYDNQDFTAIAVRRNDPTIDFNWGNGSPDPALGANTFSVRWTGQIESAFTETYTFRTRSDDGVRLFVNGQTVIDEYVPQVPTSHTGSIALVAGEKVDIEIEYFEAGGGAVMELYWSSLSVPEEIVPTAALFSEEAIPVEALPRLSTEVVVSGLSQPTAIEFAPDGTMFVLQKDGRVYTVAPGGSTPALFLDHRAAVNNVRDRGALGFSLHPDFPNTPYVYLSYTYDPPETIGQSGLAAPDQAGNRGARVSRFTADVNTGYTTAVPNSELVILGTNSTWDNIVRPDLDSTGNIGLPPSGFDENGDPIRDFIATDSQSHTIGALDFGLDGNLYVSVGDGTSYGAVDPRTTRVQDVNNFSGKILRVDPITGRGLTDNPFYDGDLASNASKVYALGLRNPYRNAIHPVTGDLYIGDVGWNRWEEINVASAPISVGGAGGGENFGWPYYEGGGGQSLQQVTGYQNLSEAQAFYASNPDVTAPFWSKSHGDGARAIILGDFNTSATYPGYDGALFFLDYQRPTIQAALFKPDGTFDREVVAADTPGNVVEMTMGNDGYMYWVDLGGNVGRLTFPVV